MDIIPCLRNALQLLLQATEYAAEMNRDEWEFAVEIAYLQEVGLTVNDIRWLIFQDYVQHAVEINDPRNESRVFQNHSKLLASHSCFVLTPRGIEFARSINANGLPARQGPSGPSGTELIARPRHAEILKPNWDKDRRALLYGPHIVKQFKVPAPNQEIILATFDEEDWPVRIDDPLPNHSAMDSKRRLHDTINSLNRNQKITLLRFQGDGTGESICWYPQPTQELDATSSRSTSLQG
jgi:hypothetical protein